MSSDVENPSAPPTGTRFCSRCNRLMAEEPGDLCDHCEPPAVAFAAVEPPSPPFATVTWSLIGITTIASSLALTFTHEQFPLGAAFSPSIAGGQWWLIVTSNFVHYSFGHWAGNMIGLWFLGRRYERIAGHWTFLAFYLACGIIGSMAELFFYPESGSAGASAAVFGVCGGLIAHYALQWRGLSRRQWLKLAALVVFTAASIWPSRVSPGIGNAAHVGGVAAGLVLGLILSTRFGQSAAVRRWAFGVSGLLVVIAAVTFRQRHIYLIHLDKAARALQSGQTETATRELHTALAMKPDSPVAQFLIGKLRKASPPDDACRLPSSRAPDSPADPCSVLQCDGQRHMIVHPDQSALSYTWNRSESDPSFENGVRTKTVVELILLQETDSFGEPICSQGWMRAATVKSTDRGLSGRSQTFGEPDFSKAAWQPLGPRSLPPDADAP